MEIRAWIYRKGAYALLGRASARCCDPYRPYVRAGELPHVEVSQARSVTACCRALVARMNSASVLVSTSVYGRPCRRVWCRTGSPAESIWLCTCRRPSVARGHSKIRRDRERRNVLSVSQRSHRHPVHSIDQSSSARGGLAVIAPSRCVQSRATASSPVGRRGCAERG